MANRSKPCQEGKGSEVRKPYRSPIEGKGTVSGPGFLKGAVEQSSSTADAPHPLHAARSAESGTSHAPEAAEDHQQPIRVLLSKKASEALTAAGEGAFVVIGKVSWPDDPERWAVHAVPCSIEACNNAVAVARGEKRAVNKPANARLARARTREAGADSGGTIKGQLATDHE